MTTIVNYPILNRMFHKNTEINLDTKWGDFSSRFGGVLYEEKIKNEANLIKGGCGMSRHSRNN